MPKNEDDIEKNLNIDLNSTCTPLKTMTYNTVSEMLSETKKLSIGTIVKIDSFRYEVATENETNHHLTTASGNKLFVLPLNDGVLNALAFNAKGDGIEGVDGIVTADSVTFISASMSFVATDIGKLITIGGAGVAGQTHVTTISGFICATEITLNSAPINSKSHAKFAYGTNDTASLNTLFRTARNVGELIILKGNYCTTSEVSVKQNNFRIEGIGRAQGAIWSMHNGICLSYKGSPATLSYNKFSINNLRIVNKMFYALDASFFPKNNCQGSIGLKLTNCFSSGFDGLHIEHFETDIVAYDSAILTFKDYVSRNCWNGFTPTGFTNTITFLGGVQNNSAIQLERVGDDKHKKIVFIGVDFEAASHTLTIGHNSTIQDCRIERLNTSRKFFKWLRITGNYNVIERTGFFWDGHTSEERCNLDDFILSIEGNYNRVELGEIYNHDRLVKITGNNNTIIVNGRFMDFEKTNRNNKYIRSSRMFLDLGVNNKFVYTEANSEITIDGTNSYVGKGALNSFIPDNPFSEIEIPNSNMKFSKLPINPPFHTARSHNAVKRVEITNTRGVKEARIRAMINGTAVNADGGSNYSVSAWVYIPSGQAKFGISISVESGIYDYFNSSDVTNKWVLLTHFSRAPMGAGVFWSLKTNAYNGGVFYVAFPTLSAGICPIFVDRPLGNTGQIYLGNVSSLALRDNGFLYERGTWVPETYGFIGAISSTSGDYVRTGEKITFKVKIIGNGIISTFGTSYFTLPSVNGDGMGNNSNTGETSNFGICLIRNGKNYLSTTIASNSLEITGTYIITD